MHWYDDPHIVIKTGLAHSRRDKRNDAPMKDKPMILFSATMNKMNQQQQLIVKIDNFKIDSGLLWLCS